MQNKQKNTRRKKPKCRHNIGMRNRCAHFESEENRMKKAVIILTIAVLVITGTIVTAYATDEPADVNCSEEFTISEETQQEPTVEEVCEQEPEEMPAVDDFTCEPTTDLVIEEDFMEETDDNTAEKFVEEEIDSVEDLDASENPTEEIFINNKNITVNDVVSISDTSAFIVKDINSWAVLDPDTYMHREIVKIAICDDAPDTLCLFIELGENEEPHIRKTSEN